MKFEFAKDENNFQLKKVFKDNTKIKQIHIDIYPENPLTPSTSFMLLLRTSEKNAIVLNDDNRLVLRKNDKFNTCFMNILFSKITECFYETNDNYSEFILNIQNIYYRMTVLN